MPVNRLDSRFLERTDVLDNITPKVVKNEGIEGVIAPLGPHYPAPYLPIQFMKTNRDAGTDAFVISSGKVVAQDEQGFIVPAGLKAQLKGGAGALVYTSDDVDWHVTDLVTGEELESTQSYSTLEVALAILERGLILEQRAADAGATIPPTTNTHGEDIIDLFIGSACGISHYDVNVWSGLPEKGDIKLTNYSKQHAVQYLTMSILAVPHFVAGSQASDTIDFNTLNTGGTETASDGDQVDAGEYWDSTNLAELTRYSAEVDAGDSVVAVGLDPAGTGDQYRVAKNTDRTPFESDISGILTRERNSISGISKEGDWWLDEEIGVLFLHSDTWDTQVAATATATLSYNYYDQAATSAHKQVHFDDVGSPGDFLTFDDQSNFRVATDAEISAGKEIVGRLMRFESEPRGLLDKVKTAWNFEGVSKSGQMPGTATKGYSDMITLSDETVADEAAIIRLFVR